MSRSSTGALRLRLLPVIKQSLSHGKSVWGIRIRVRKATQIASRITEHCNTVRDNDLSDNYGEIKKGYLESLIRKLWRDNDFW
nr:hypothetical protein Itr_chr01CG16880 [Ipomoea trifida]